MPTQNRPLPSAAVAQRKHDDVGTTMSDASNAPLRRTRAVRPSKEAKLAQAKRRRGPRLTPPARKRHRSDMERFFPPVTLTEWVESMREARRYLGRIDWRRLRWNAQRGTLSPRQSRVLLRLVACVMRLLLRIAYRSNPAEFNQLLNLTGFGDVIVRQGDAWHDHALFALKEFADSMGDTPYQADPPLEFVINLTAAIEKLDKLGVNLDEVFPAELTRASRTAA